MKKPKYQVSNKGRKMVSVMLLYNVQKYYVMLLLLFDSVFFTYTVYVVITSM